MKTQSELNFVGIQLRVQDPEAVSQWLSDTLGIARRSVGPGWKMGWQGCEIHICKSVEAAPFQEAGEGYYTGLAHIALRSSDLRGAVQLCIQKGIVLAGGQEISHNPDIWGPGMDYVNPICPFGFGLEICQRLDLPSTPMTLLTDGLEHIGIPVPEIEQSVEFYQNLGFSKASSAEIHRADGKKIYCVMMQGWGVTLELFEFAKMGHEPYHDQPFRALLFESADPESWMKAHPQSCARDAEGVAQVQGPGGEILMIGKREARDEFNI